MRFIVPINEATEGQSQTCHVITTNSNCRRTNRRHLRDYFLAVGVPVTQIKKVMKAMGFTGERLGV
jgi:hypothetical protein